MKNKDRKEKIKLLRRAIKVRLRFIEEKKDVDDKVTLINQIIIKKMKALRIKIHQSNGRTIRVMQMDRDIWDEDALYEFIKKKVNKKSADEAVKEVPSTRKVDDDVVLRLIQEKQITLKQVKKYITVKSGVPFVRSF